MPISLFASVLPMIVTVQLSTPKAAAGGTLETATVGYAVFLMLLFVMVGALRQRRSYR